MKKEKNEKKSSKPKYILGILICLIITSAIFIPTIKRGWVFYDESAIYEEVIAPIPNSFGELKEILSSFGFVNNLSSNNFLYSSNSVNRTSLLGTPFLLLVQLLFKKNAIYYHLFNFVFHILNMLLVYFTLKHILNKQTFFYRAINVLLTSIWAIHPVQIESIILSTNIGATLSYFIFFTLFLLHLKLKEYSKVSSSLVFLVFLTTMFFNEYIIALPGILITYTFIQTYENKKGVVKSLGESLKINMPYIIGVLTYLVFFLFGYKFSQAGSENTFLLTAERIFWLAPQIIFHYFKLILFPKTLSIDQTAFVNISEVLFSVKAIAKSFLIFTVLLLPLSTYLLKKKGKNYLILSSLFFISILPFSQVLSPTYCLCAERYLYTPLFFVIFGFAHIVNNFDSTSSDTSQRKTLFFKKIATSTFLSIVLILCFFRSSARANDWNNNETLITKTIETSPNHIYKGFRINSLIEQVISKDINRLKEVDSYVERSNSHFQKALSEYSNKDSENQPAILSSYGLDNESLKIKTVYFIAKKAILYPGESAKDYIKLFEKTSKDLNKYNAETLELYANLLFNNKQYDDSKEIFLFANKKYPTSPFILISLTRFSREKEGNIIESNKYLDKALKLYPYSKYNLLEAIRNREVARNFKDYSKYCYLYGLRTHSVPHYQAALSGFLNLNDYNNAEKTITKIFKLGNVSPLSFYLASNYYIKRNELIPAIKLLSNANDLISKEKVDDNLSFDITNTLAKLYFETGEVQKGIEMAKEAYKYSSSNPQNKKLIDNLLIGTGVQI